jgi:nitrogen fixation/metabolism regulation signal transduction histidine kinase
MRLRTRLLLAFAPLAIVPLAAVLPVAQSNLRRTLSRELESRLDGAADAATTALRARGQEVRQSVEELAGSTAAEEVARAIHSGAPPARQASTAGRLMRTRGLSVLSLLDSRGVTLSSGHLPARLGDPDPHLFALAQGTAAEPRVAMVELSDAAGLREAPAIAVARPVDYGELRLWAVGGALLDQPLADRLADLTRARVEIVREGAVLVGSGNAAPPVVTRELPLGEGVAVRLSLSRAAQREALAGITTAFVGVAALGLALTLALGAWLARRITRSIEALTAGARRVASGDLEAKVSARASGEVGELIAAFNQMTADLQRTTERLVASERIAAWQDVARRLAHEIKNPLTPIKMSLETLLAANEAHSPKFEELFGQSTAVVLEEVERLRRIVDEFSHFARLPKPSLAPVDLSELVAQVLSLYSARPDGISVTPELESALPVRVDRDQLTQVLLNLVKNAEEAMPGGGRIVVRTRRAGGSAHLEIEDSGPGVPPENRLKILEPYFTTKAGGTGLGLAIASRICQEHGGALEVDGAPGQGALFRVVLPLDRPSP